MYRCEYDLKILLCWFHKSTCIRSIGRDLLVAWFGVQNVRDAVGGERGFWVFWLVYGHVTDRPK